MEFLCLYTVPRVAASIVEMEQQGILLLLDLGAKLQINVCGNTQPIRGHAVKSNLIAIFKNILILSLPY